MANTMTLIASQTLASAVSSVTFSSIPSTYTDLQLVVSARGTTQYDNGGYVYYFYPNGATTNLSMKYLNGSGSAATSGSDTSAFVYMTPSDYTASTFSNNSIYMQNYTSSNYKYYSTDSVMENNATAANRSLQAGLWSQTTAISSLTLTTASANFAVYSSFYLYGIKNS
jgi:hypothetical protein